MEKYYIGRLEETSNKLGVAARVVASKLVDVQFSRRPPTFGSLHLVELEDEAHYDHKVTQQWLKLTTLNLGSSQSVKFALVREINLTAAAAAATTASTRQSVVNQQEQQQQQQQQQLQQHSRLDRKVIDFSTLNDQLLLEISHSNTSLERARSSCFALTQSGDLFIVSLIDADEAGAGVAAKPPPAGQLLIGGIQAAAATASGRTMKHVDSDERFIGFKLARTHDHLLDQQLAARNQFAIQVHVLSDKAYYHFKLLIRSTKLDCDIQLISSYSLQDVQDKVTRTLRFEELVPIETSDAIVLLKLSDNSTRFVKNGKCLQTIQPTSKPREPTKTFAFAPRLSNETIILLEYSSHRITASSLLIEDPTPSSVQQTNSTTTTTTTNQLDFDDSLEPAPGDERDPDNLLPRTPSFELDECWSLDLSQIDGIHSRLMDSDEGDEGGQQSADLARACCLCPLWSEQVLGGASKSMLAHDDDQDELGARQRLGWPKFLLVSCLGHVLIYCCEHDDELPFPIVYDRAFLDLEPEVETTTTTTTTATSTSTSSTAKTSRGSTPVGKRAPARALVGKSIDLRLKPRLVHNFKLVGSSPSDALMNLLLLNQRAHLNELRYFGQLGLLIGSTDRGHLLAFKLTSQAIFGRKDNLYQQSLLASLRGPALLQAEIQRVESLTNDLREQLISLDAGQLEVSKPTNGIAGAAGELEQLISAELNQDGLMGALCHLRLEWPSLIDLKRVLIVSTSNSRLMPIKGHQAQESGRIKSFELNHLDHDRNGEETAKSGPNCEIPFISLMSNQTDTIKASDWQKLSESSIKAWALIELNPSDHSSERPRTATPFGKDSLDLPVFIRDSQQFEGQLQAYFVFRCPISQGPFEDDNGRLHAMAGMRVRNSSRLAGSFGAESKSVGSADRFSKQLVQIKPLHSYRPLDELAAQRDASLPPLSLNIEGSFSDKQIVSWLGECLDIDLAKLQRQIQANQSASDPIELIFGSSFTHCFIKVQLRRRAEIEGGPQGDGQMSIQSDDFIALNLIERRIFKRATDESVQLARSSGAHLLVVSNDYLIHLIGRQWINIDLYLSLREKNILGGQLGDSRKREQQIDLLLENLMSEALNIQSLPVRQDLKQSTGWLERSLRQDLEKVVGSHETDDRKSKGQLATFLDMICDYIMDVLVNHDQFHQRAPVTSAQMLQMRTKLVQIIEGPTGLSQIKFANRVLSEWNECKSKA